MGGFFVRNSIFDLFECLLKNKFLLFHVDNITCFHYIWIVKLSAIGWQWKAFGPPKQSNDQSTSILHDQSTSILNKWTNSPETDFALNPFVMFSCCSVPLAQLLLVFSRVQLCRSRESYNTLPRDTFRYL